jgi:hypothetical protein
VVPETRERPPRRGARDLPRQAVLHVRQVAGGARRSIAGALLFALVGWGVLLLTLPRIMAYLLAALAFLLAGGGAWHVFVRWRHRDR